MRLLNTLSYELAEFLRGNVPPYAILSHTWGDEEVGFKDIMKPHREEMMGFSKIRACCARARQDELHWVWIDTCCIDKSSSAELSEAINSMYRWYRNASVCYAYLFDVPPLDPFLNEQKFRSARWFTRGWCLQELLAPRQLEFYAEDWTELGTKWSLKNIIADVTGVPVSVLMQMRQNTDCLVAERMSWASGRKTTRPEDEAYCLIGIFDVNMPLLYGEGSRAFIRLQEEIMKREEDYTLFLWQTPRGMSGGGLLCDSPLYFSKERLSFRLGGCCKYSDLVAAEIHGIDQKFFKSLQENAQLRLDPPQITCRGLRMNLLTKPYQGDYRLAWMFYFYEDYLVCILLKREQQGSRIIWEKARSNFVETIPMQQLSEFELEEVYLPILSESPATELPEDTLSIKIYAKTINNYDLSILSVYPDDGLQYNDAGFFELQTSPIDCPEKMGILFSSKGMTGEAKFAALLSLFHGPWGCLIIREAEPETLRDLVRKPPIPPSLKDDVSDRAISRLPNGTFATIATKTRPGSFVAHISLLAVGEDAERSAARSIRPQYSRSE
jgi:hypothetical protein